MPDCIVIGGGVIGLLTARALHQQGVDVLLIERGRLGGESTWAGGGILSPLYPWLYDDSVNVLAEQSKKLYPALVKALKQETGQDSEIIQSGLLVTDIDEKESALLWAQKWAVKAQAVSGKNEISTIEPQINTNIDSGIWMPDVMQVRNPSLVTALKLSMDIKQIRYREQTPVEKILIKDNRVTGVKLKGETLLCPKIIVASGAWSSTLLDQPVDIDPVKGQMIMYRGEANLVRRIVLSKGHYIIPRSDGRILAGSTIEKKGFDKTLSEEAMAELHEAAIHLIPALETMAIERQWAGLRPGTLHGVPYICEHETTSGLFINSGHFRNGIVLGLASAALMTNILLGKTTTIDTSPYRIGAKH